MSNRNQSIVDDLAKAYGGGLADDLRRQHIPTPPPAPAPRRVAASGPAEFHRPIVEARMVPAGNTVKVGPYEVARRRMMDSEHGAVSTGYKPKPNREKVVLTASDWEALAETPVPRGMNFDDWCKEVCLPPLVRDFDPDYSAAARLFLAKKKEAHQR